MFTPTLMLCKALKDNTGHLNAPHSLGSQLCWNLVSWGLPKMAPIISGSLPEMKWPNNLPMCTETAVKETSTFDRTQKTHRDVDISEIMAGQPIPPNVPPRNRGLIRPSEGKPMVKKPWIRPYFCGGGGTLGLGDRLTSPKHNAEWQRPKCRQGPNYPHWPAFHLPNLPTTKSSAFHR